VRLENEHSKFNKTKEKEEEKTITHKSLETAEMMEIRVIIPYLG